MEAVWALLMAGGWFAGEMTLLLWGMVSLIVVVPLGIIAALTELPDEKEVSSGARILGSLFLFAAMIALLQWGGLPLWNVVSDHVLFACGALAGCLAMGVLWSMWKFKLFSKDCQSSVVSIVSRFCGSEGLKEDQVLMIVDDIPNLSIPEEKSHAWERYFRDNISGKYSYGGATAESPTVTFLKNKERITLWILFWPASMLRSMFKDILARLLEELIMSLRRVYEGIAKRHAVTVNYKKTDPQQV